MTHSSISSPIKSFDELPLVSPLRQALINMGYLAPTPIQAQSIPVLLKGRDIVACAQTGTGKTAAFSIPLLMHLETHKNETALVLVPTRELAQQVAQVLRDLTQNMPELRMAVLIGGMPFHPQFRALKKNPQIIVATPGRLNDHLNQRSARLDRCTFLVLDEADRMLDMGFEPQLRDIVGDLPKKRQTLLFSATVPPKIRQLAQKYLTQPVDLSVGQESVAAPKISQRTREVSGEDKQKVLVEELQKRDGLVLVFTRTKVRTDRVAKFLRYQDIAVASIHGGKTQGQRRQALELFKNGQVKVLVATDVAARGLDVPAVEHVINFDLPLVAEDYVHRIGRTGRAGRSGEALSLIAPDERILWRSIFKLLNPGATAPAVPGGRPGNRSRNSKWSQGRRKKPFRASGKKQHHEQRSKNSHPPRTH